MKKDTADSCMLAKKWLESDSTGVKSLNTCPDSLGRKKHQGTSQGIGARQIAKFLSKEGKAIRYAQVSKYIRIEEQAIDEIKKE